MVVWEHIWGWGTQEGGKEEHRLSLSVFGRMLVDIKLTRKEGLVRRGNDGQRKQLQTYRTCFKTCMEVPNNISQKQATGKKQVEQQRKKIQTRRSHAQNCTYATPEFGLKTSTKITTTTREKRITLLHYNTHP